MRWVLSVIPLLLCFPYEAFACTCLASNASACSALASTPVVFVGKVTRDTGGKIGTRFGRMKIEEVIHGLPNDIKEVDVDTMPRTSCYMPLERDETYVIYGSRDAGGLIRYHSCSFSFQVNGHEVLLDALRESAKGGASRLVGFIRQKSDLFTGVPAVSGISVLARNGSTTLQTSTKVGGQYEFRTIPPGDWNVDIDSTLFKIDRTYERRAGVTVAAGTCEVKNIDIVTDGHIKGTIRDAKGNGIPNIPVEAFAIDSKNEPESTALRKATTDAAGHYDIGALPAREYIVAVNGEKYEDRLSYPPTFYPAGSRRDLAQRINLDGAEQRDGIDLVLPLPRETAKLILEVLDEIGQPIEGALASVENVEGIQRVYSVYNKSGKDGRLELTLWRGETYVIESFLYSSQLLPSKPEAPRLALKEWRGKTGAIYLGESENYAKVTLRLMP